MSDIKIKPIKIISPCYECEKIKCDSNNCEEYNLYYKDTNSKKDNTIDILGTANRIDKIILIENHNKAFYNKKEK